MFLVNQGSNLDVAVVVPDEHRDYYDWMSEWLRTERGIHNVFVTNASSLLEPNASLIHFYASMTPDDYVIGKKELARELRRHIGSRLSDPTYQADWHRIFPQLFNDVYKIQAVWRHFDDLTEPALRRCNLDIREFDQHMENLIVPAPTQAAFYLERSDGALPIESKYCKRRL